MNIERVLGMELAGNISYETSLSIYVTSLFILEKNIMSKYYFYSPS